MNPTDFTVLETITKPDGFEFDLQEAFRKLASSQFGGNPGRGFCELIQNAMDSYPSAIPVSERKIHIRTSADTISVRDEGEGMSMERINLLATLGGTDKNGSPDKIGRFGMGFFAVFNPKLQTRKVQVRTRCRSQIVILEFIVDEIDPTRLPQLRTELISKGVKHWQGSEVTVQFRNSASLPLCLGEAKKFVRYFPCPVFIDGARLAETVWEEGRRKNARFFGDSACHGFLEASTYRHDISLLCKYEPITQSSVNWFAAAPRPPTGDLRDLKMRGMPYVPGTFTLVNDSRLNVTVSRDSLRIDREYATMVRTLATAHLSELRTMLRQGTNLALIVANQFVFAAGIRLHLKGLSPGDHDPLRQVIAELADLPVYRLAGQPERISLRYIWEHRSVGKPVFYSPRGHNVMWLGGAFEHDFVVLPPELTNRCWGKDFYDHLFGDVFEDAVNLDTIRENSSLIQDLVQRGIVQPELLNPKCEIIGYWQATGAEQRFIAEINHLLALPEIQNLIQQALHVSRPPREATLFSLHDQGLVVATGLFDADGQAYNPDPSPTSASRSRARTSRWVLPSRTSTPRIPTLRSADSHRKRLPSSVWASATRAACCRGRSQYCFKSLPSGWAKHLLG